VKDPNFWSRICVHNMAKLSREATTFRRVLESLFRHFDNNNSWSSLNTLALSVLLDMQMLMENSGAPFVPEPLILYMQLFIYLI
jgi:hypothetical protein